MFMLASLGLDPTPTVSACVWLNAAAAARRGTSRPLVAAFARATLAGVWAPALARYPANRRYLERTSRGWRDGAGERC